MKQLIIIMLICTFLGCSNDAQLTASLQTDMKEKKGDELLVSLLELDQTYPDRFILKLNIGAMYLARNDRDKATVFLKRGEALVGSARNASDKAVLYANLAELSLREGRYDESIGYADKSLSFDAADPLGVMFTKAKSEKLARRDDDAIATFNTAWQSGKEKATRDDLLVYLSLLQQRNEYERALEVLDMYAIKFPYEEGHGIIESVCYEKIGRIDESVLAAVKDLEYRHWKGRFAIDAVLDRLDELDRKLDDRTWNPKALGRQTVRGCRFFLSGKYELAYGELNRSGVADRAMPYFVYAMTSCRLETGTTDNRVFETYESVGKYFSSFPGYHYHLYRGLIASRGTSGLRDLRAVMESCIVLAPNTSYAKETRIALGKQIGLSAREAESILLGAELDAIELRISGGASPEILAPVMALVTLNDNVYTLAAVLMLGRVKQVGVVRDYLDRQRKDSRGRLRERLDMILG